VNKYSLLLLFFLLPLKSWSLTCGDAIDISPLDDHFKIEEKLNPKISREFCWAKMSCPDFKANKEMPKDFECPEGFARPYAKYLDDLFSCPISKEEAFSIIDYTYTAHECLNRYLRQTDVKSKSVDYYVDRLNQTLDKLPDYEGFVVRGATLPIEIKAQHSKGKIVTYEAFTSTSTKSKPWGDQTFLIYSKTGKPVMNISMANSEYEVLFKSGTKFKVLDISGKENSELFIMKEINEPLTPSADLKEDKMILKKVKKSKKNKNFRMPDEWHCNPQEMKSKILQDQMPEF
jgi:hypothetical protein